MMKGFCLNVSGSNLGPYSQRTGTKVSIAAPVTPTKAPRMVMESLQPTWSQALLNKTAKAWEFMHGRDKQPRKRRSDSHRRYWAPWKIPEPSSKGQCDLINLAAWVIKSNCIFSLNVLCMCLSHSQNTCENRESSQGAWCPFWLHLTSYVPQGRMLPGLTCCPKSTGRMSWNRVSLEGPCSNWLGSQPEQNSSFCWLVVAPHLTKKVLSESE